MKLIDGIPIWGTPDEGAVSQIKTCAKTADRVALTAESIGQPLLQVRGLSLGLLQDGYVRVGVFPQREKVLIGGARFGVVSLQEISASKTEMR